jgi:hypothetical protein
VTERRRNEKRAESGGRQASVNIHEAPLPWSRRSASVAQRRNDRQRLDSAPKSRSRDIALVPGSLGLDPYCYEGSI